MAWRFENMEKFTTFDVVFFLVIFFAFCLVHFGLPLVKKYFESEKKTEVQCNRYK